MLTYFFLTVFAPQTEIEFACFVLALS